jgi:hypothetical protein
MMEASSTTTSIDLENGGDENGVLENIIIPE